MTPSYTHTPTVPPRVRETHLGTGCECVTDRRLQRRPAQIKLEKGRKIIDEGLR